MPGNQARISINEALVEPTRLRRLIQLLLPNDEHLDDFCRDYFPQVMARFGAGMDRGTKLNLLFEQVSKAVIAAALMKKAPQQAKAFLAGDVLAEYGGSMAASPDARLVGVMKMGGQAEFGIKSPAHLRTVWCSYAHQDQPFMAELKRHLEALQQQGLLEYIEVIAEDELGDDLDLYHADVFLILLSADYLASKRAQQHMEIALAHHAQEGTTILPVLVRPVLWETTPLASVAVPLPAGASVSSLLGADRERAWVDVASAVRQAILFPPASRRDLAPSVMPLVSRPIEEIFAHSGQPDVTFVKTAQSQELQQRLRHMGEGLVVEGPSGVGKTTAVLRALEELGKRDQTTYLLGTDPEDLGRLDELVQRSLPQGGHLVVDDFHRLSAQRQSALALLIKRLSDRNRRDAKVTLIGINPVGATLVHDLPEMQRYSVIQMRGRQSAEEIDQLISKGEQAANIELKRRAEFIRMSEHSFAIAQRLCYEAALKAGVTETAKERISIDVSPEDVFGKVHRDLGYRYRALLLAFAAAGKGVPPKGAGLLLLWHLLRSEDSSVVVQEVRYQHQQGAELDGAFQWILESNLAKGLFAQNAGLRRLLYYNGDTGVLSAEDPHLSFYLRHLDWLEFARASGHAVSTWDPEQGPQFTTGASALTSSQRDTTLRSTPFILVHLSDLHFGGAGKAKLWYSQVAEDLKRELQLTRPDAVVLTGDIANHATDQEYQEALEFVRDLSREFNLLPHQIIPLPGNHDINWSRSEDAYEPQKRKSVPGLIEGHYFAESPTSQLVEVRNEHKYKHRLEPFAAFYREVRREAYPLEPGQQALVYHFPEAQVLLLGLNSAWEVDHHFRARSSIDAAALSSALDEIRTTPAFDHSLIKIALFHHPVGGSDEAALKNQDFLSRLAQAGFCMALHGHLHEAGDTEHRFYRTLRGLQILAAGTFGAPGRDRPPGVPLHYQVLELRSDSVRIRSRRRSQADGAWEPDCRYRQRPGQANLDEVTLPLHESTKPPTSASS